MALITCVEFDARPDKVFETKSRTELPYICKFELTSKVYYIVTTAVCILCCLW